MRRKNRLLPLHRKLSVRRAGCSWDPFEEPNCYQSFVFLSLFGTERVQGFFSLPEKRILDGFGGIHSCGSAQSPTWKTPDFGWDIARDMEITPTRLGCWILDGYGIVHAVGDATPVMFSVLFNRDMAVDLEMAEDGAGGWVLDTYGGIHPVGNAPNLEQESYFGWDIAVDLEMILGGKGF